MLKQAGAILNEPNTGSIVNIRCQPLYFILDKPERRLMFKIPKLSACWRSVLAGVSPGRLYRNLAPYWMKLNWEGIGSRNNSSQQHIEKKNYELKNEVHFSNWTDKGISKWGWRPSVLKYSFGRPLKRLRNGSPVHHHKFYTIINMLTCVYYKTQKAGQSHWQQHFPRLNYWLSFM